MYQFSEEDDDLREKILLVKNKWSAFVSALTKIKNKITKDITENFGVLKL